MTHLKILDPYWVFWIAVAFLIPELLAVFKVIPMDTFSGTVQISEKIHPFLKPIVFAFGVGLVTHLVYDVKFYQALIASAILSAGAQILGFLK